MTVHVIAYGSGNIRSVLSAFDRIGVAAIRQHDPAGLAAASHVLLPGVGTFAAAMGLLDRASWSDAIRAHASAGRPLHFRERAWAGVPAPLASEGYLIPAGVWRQVGGFNERFVVYCEDLEWQERARRAGLTLRLVRECSFEHLGNGSSSTMVFAPTFYLLRNVIWIHRVRTGRRLGRQHLRQFRAKSAPLLRRAVRESVQSPSRAMKRILAILLAGGSGVLTSPGRAVPHDPDAFIRARRPEHWGLVVR